MAETVVHNKNATDLAAGLPESGIVHWEQLRPVLTRITQALQLDVSLDGIEGSEITGGIHLKVP